MENTVPRVSPVQKLPLTLNGFRTNLVYLLIAVAVVFGGVITGWFLSGRGIKLFGGSPAAPGARVAEKEAGIADESTFTDTAEGQLEKGALNGEGTHTLVRSGGASKNIALTSTVIDLDSFTGKKVQVWGQTLASVKAPWLMDVGKLKVIE